MPALAYLESLLYCSLEAREKVASYSRAFEEAKESHVVAKTCSRRSLQDGYLARVLQDGRLSYKILHNNSNI